MSERVPSVLSGLVLWDRRFGLETLNTGDLQQAGPQPAQPQPSPGNAGVLELQQLGSVVGAGGEQTVRIQAGGRASREPPGASFLIRDADSTADTDWCGHLSFRHPGHPESVQWFSTVTAPGFQSGCGSPSVIRAADGGLVAAFVRDMGASISDPMELCVARRQVGSSTWAVQVIAELEVMHPVALVEMPTATGHRLVLTAIREVGPGPTPAAVMALWTWWSQDDGATWSEGARGALGWSQATGLAVASLRMCAHDGYLTAWVDGTDASGRSGIHLLSPDGGESWEQVEDVAASSHDIRLGQPVALDDGAVALVYLDGTDLKWATKATPAGAFVDSPDWDTDLMVGPRSGLGYDAFAATKGPDGLIYVLARDDTSRERLRIAVIDPTDPAAASGPVPDDRRYGIGRGVYDSGDAGRSLFGLTTSPRAEGEIAIAGGQLWYLGRCRGGPAAAAMWAVPFGGYTSIDWVDYGPDTQRVWAGFGYASIRNGWAWLPCYTSNYGPVTVTSTSSTATLQAAGELLESTGTSSQRQHLIDFTASPFSTTPGHWNRCYTFRTDVQQGGATGTNEIALQIWATDGSEYVSVEMLLLSTSVELRDGVTTLPKGAATGLATGPREYCLQLARPDPAAAPVARLFVREPGERVWEEAATGSLGFAPGALERLAWGHLAATAAGDRTSQWGSIVAMGLSDQGLLVVPGDGAAAWPGFLAGRRLLTEPLDLVDGRRIVASGGVTLRGDEWICGTRYDRPAALVFPTESASGDDYWESVDTAAQLFRLQMADGLPYRPGSGSLSLYVDGANAPLVQFGYMSGASFVQLAQLDLSSGMTGLQFVRDGRTMWADPGGPAVGRTFLPQELEGATLLYVPASGPPVAYEIASNTPGMWGGAGAQTQLTLAGDVSAIAGAPGDRVELVARRGLLLVHDQTVGRAEWAVRIPPGQVTPSGTYRMGALWPGRFRLWPQRPDWGSTSRVRPNVEIHTARGGQRSATGFGRPRRRWTLAWPSGIDESRAVQGTADWLAPRAGYAAAGSHDPEEILGMLLDLNGAELPGVLVPRMPAPGGTVQQILDRRLIRPGRLVGDLRDRVRLGLDGWSALRSVEVLSFEEEL